MYNLLYKKWQDTFEAIDFCVKKSEDSDQSQPCIEQTIDLYAIRCVYKTTEFFALIAVFCVQNLELFEPSNVLEFEAKQVFKCYKIRTSIVKSVQIRVHKNMLRW